jgi:ATP synthase protein I
MRSREPSAGAEKERDELARSVERTRARRSRWRLLRERPLARNLALAGTLGWLFVVPVVGGALLGRVLDRRFASGIFWSAALIFLGAALGGWMLWQRLREEE